MKLVKAFKACDFESSYRTLVDAMEVLWDHVALLNSSVQEVSSKFGDIEYALADVRKDDTKSFITLMHRMNNMRDCLESIRKAVDAPPWEESFHCGGDKSE